MKSSISCYPVKKIRNPKSAIRNQPPAARSPFRIAMRRLRRHKLAVVGLGVLVLMYFTALFADFVAPYRYDNEDRKRPYLSPDKIRFWYWEEERKGRPTAESAERAETKRDINEMGSSAVSASSPPAGVVRRTGAVNRLHISWRPFIYNRTTELELGEWLEKLDKSKRYYIKFFVKGEKYKLLGVISCRIHLFGVEAPCRIRLLGSDWNGRDIFSRICYGSRISLTVGLIGVFISFTPGLIVGGVSGYFGGLTDTVLMRLVELLMAFPAFYLLLSLTAALPRDLTSTQRYILIVVILAFLG